MSTFTAISDKLGCSISLCEVLYLFSVNHGEIVNWPFVYLLTLLSGGVRVEGRALRYLLIAILSWSLAEIRLRQFTVFRFEALFSCRWSVGSSLSDSSLTWP